MDHRRRIAILAASLALACASGEHGQDDDAHLHDTGVPAALVDSGAAPPSADASLADGAGAAADASAIDASAACLRFCECMAKDCADKVFPRGCLPECASQTKWDLPCRQNMCGLVPAQPNNDHCTHAMGVQQCLDKP
jgi:hypothetical protein